MVDAFKEAAGARMRSARERAGVSQKQLAAALGVNSSIISKTEKGDQLPSALLVCEYARAFKVTTDHILLGAPLEPRRPRKPVRRTVADGAKRRLPPPPPPKPVRRKERREIR